MIRRKHTDSSRPMCLYYILLFLLILLHTFTLLSLSVFLQTLWSDAWSGHVLRLGASCQSAKVPIQSSLPRCRISPTDPALWLLQNRRSMHVDCFTQLRVSFLIAETNWVWFLKFSPPIKYMSMSAVPRMPKHALPCSCQKHEKLWHLFRCSPLLRCSVVQVNKFRVLQW